MERDLDQDLLNVLKYNKDGINKLNQSAEDSNNRLENAIKESQQYKKDAIDISQVDREISKSMALLKQFGRTQLEIEKADEKGYQKEYKPISSIASEDIPQQDWEDLLVEIESEGYMDTVIEDILTPEEIAKADQRYAQIKQQFAKKTKLSKKDAIFLMTATALQCIRQYVLTPFDERVSADQADKKVAKKKANKPIPGSQDTKRYYTPLSRIVSNSQVPYDIIEGSKKYDLGGEKGKGLGGKTHRFRTLGHDPILGYVFGTSNILTQTLTDWRFLSYHVGTKENASGRKVPTLTEKADTAKVFDRVKTRFSEEPQAVVAAIAKQYWHIKSDNSTAGLPIPFLSVFSPELAQRLASKKIDAITLGKIGEQATWSLFINFLISTIHVLMYDEAKDGKKELYEVRTRKILLYSNLIASTSNAVVVGIGVAAGVTVGNAPGAAAEGKKIIEKSLRYLDVGGLLVTISRLFRDINFITKVKEEFIHMELEKDIQAEIDELDQIYTIIKKASYI